MNCRFNFHICNYTTQSWIGDFTSHKLLGINISYRVICQRESALGKRIQRNTENDRDAHWKSLPVVTAPRSNGKPTLWKPPVRQVFLLSTLSRQNNTTQHSPLPSRPSLVLWILFWNLRMSELKRASGNYMVHHNDTPTYRWGPWEGLTWLRRWGNW